MCGRFALGVGSQELREQLAREYFGGGGGEEVHRQGGPQAGTSSETSGSAEQGFESGQSSLLRRVQAQQGGGESDEEGGAESRKELNWSSHENESTWRPRYNVCPKSGGVVVRRTKGGSFELTVAKWGLVPHWTKSPQEDPPSTINAQMESVFEGRPTWKVRDTKRCIVVAQGFYEWMQKGKEKVPQFIKRADGKLMVFAGLWDHCEYKGNFDPVTSYTIITTPVNKQLRQIHSRMPAILDESDVQIWLSNRSFDEKVKSVIKPFAAKLEFYAVDKGVGKIGNDSKDFIKPVAQKAGSLDTLFAKQASSTPSKPNSKSDPASSTSPAPVAAKNEGPEVLLNPDEDSTLKTEEFEKVEEKEKGKGKKRVVETLELSSSEDDEAKLAKDKKKKVKVDTDDEGNVKLDGFFPVLD